ncbi:hypothetical protein CSKR_102576 [Clonorchis sinensis]|uniref:Uncharacterized protein n=1 Tax=Clonorchis sinensis TaxID=79923 RepID=A0A3R7GU44_CLOSI|nr:hypothetical protein CSKR_102576 [Clonorchis sinensis]
MDIFVEHLFCTEAPGEHPAHWQSRGPYPGRQVPPKAPKRFVISFITPARSRFDTCDSWPNLHSFWCWTQSLIEVPVAQPKTRFLITSLRISRHQPTRSETTIVEHLKTSQFRCSNRPSLTAIQQNSPHCSLIHTSFHIPL